MTNGLDLLPAHRVNKKAGQNWDFSECELKSANPIDDLDVVNKRTLESSLPEVGDYLYLPGRIGGQRMQGDYILADILKNAEDSIVTLNVATTGDDTTGDGTLAKPYKTIERACEDINKYVNVFYSIIKVADGTYSNSFVNFPNTVRGIIQVIGNINNPNAVVIEGNGSDCPLNITGEQVVDFEGFTIQGVGEIDTINIDSAKLYMRGVRVMDGMGIYANNAYIKLESSSALGTMPFDIDQPFSSAVYAVNTVADIDVNLNITNSYIGIAGVNGSIIRQGISSLKNVSITSKGGDYEEGVQVFGGATYYCFGNLTYNGTKATAKTNVGISIGDRSLFFMVSPRTLAFSNCKYGIFVDGSSKLNGSTPTITASNVDTNLYFDYSTIYSWGVSPAFFKSDDYGFDERYNLQGDGWTGSFTNGDGDTVTVVNGQITNVA